MNVAAEQYVFGSANVNFYDAQLAQNMERRVRFAKAEDVGKKIACPVCGIHHIKRTDSTLFCNTPAPKGLSCSEIYAQTIL